MRATIEARTQTTIEEHAARLAARQHGVVTRRQLRDAGFAEAIVDRRVAAGIFLSLHRGVYLLGTLRGRLEPEWARVVAARLACGADAVVSHASAGWLWRLLRRPNRAAPVSITVPEAARRQRPGILIHRSVDLTRAEITRIEGIPVTRPGRTLRDLATVLTVKELNRAAGRVERRGLIDSAGFPALVASHAGRPGAPVLRAALLGDGGIVLTRSEAEERLLALILEHGLPQPQVNVPVEGLEVDFYWPDLKLVIEADGFAYHNRRGSFENDHQRDLELKARGFTVMRVTWRQLVEEPKATAGLINRSFGHAEARAARPPVR